MIPEEAPEWTSFWESLDAWGDNLPEGTLPDVHWGRMRLAAWARSVLKFTTDSAKMLIEQQLNGPALGAINSVETLNFLMPIPANTLWNVIEKLKQKRTYI